MTELTNTKAMIDAYCREMTQALQSLYDPAKCRTVQQLKQLMEGEGDQLAELQHEITFGLRKRCHEALRSDGVPYPEMAWAEHIGSRYSTMYFPSIHHEALPQSALEALDGNRPAPRMEAQQPDPAAASARPAENASRVKTGLVSAGLGVTAMVLHGVTSIGSWLLLLGIVMTMTGTLTIFSSRSRTQSPAAPQTAQPAPAQSAAASVQSPDEQAIVQKILTEQLARCTQALTAYCRDALTFAMEIAEKAGDEKS